MTKSVKQVAVADRIVLTKTDLAGERTDALVARLRGAQSGGADPRCRGRRGDAAAPARLRPLRSRTQDPRRQALAGRGSLCGSARPPSPPSRSQSARRPHSRVHARDRHGNPGTVIGDVPRARARDARAESAALQGRREGQRDAGAAGRHPRRSAPHPPAGAARALARRRPSHAARVHHPRHGRARDPRTCSAPSSARSRPTGPTAPRSSTIRWCRSADDNCGSCHAAATPGC